MSEFHLLRPEWLLALIPLFFASFLTFKKQTLAGQWQKLIHPKLQAHVISGNDAKPIHQAFKAGPLFLGAFIGILAMTGPTWEKQNAPTFNSRAGLVIALDLSLSMSAQDIAPSRLQRAKYKITDVLDHYKDQAIGLIAYSGDAHTAAPLTRDTNTIKSMLPALDPYIMPAAGSNLVRLVEEAAELFEQSGSQPRQLLLVTDGVEAMDIQPSIEILHKHAIELSILAVGTEEGAPIVRPDGRFFKDQQGNVIMPQLEWSELQTLAREAGAPITKLANNDQDIRYLIKSHSNLNQFEKTDDNIEFDQWHDSGYWLALLCLPLALFGFRKGLLSIPIAIGLATASISPPAAAFEWKDLFRNADQRARAKLEESPTEAEKIFRDKQWQATSAFKAENYENAAKIWSQFDDADSHYNRGNALAKLNKYDEAIESYEKALEKDPLHDKASKNKSLVEYLKQAKEQNNQQQDGDQNDQSDNQEQSNEDNQQQGSNSQNSQQQNGEEQGSENQSSQEQQASGQQNSDQSEDASSQSGQKDGESSYDPDEFGKQQASKGETSEERDAMQKNAEGEQKDMDSQEQLAERAQSDEESHEAKENGKRQTMQPTEAQQDNSEQAQAMTQWLQRVPDDPGGLLRNKFLYQYKNRDQQSTSEDRKPW